MEEEGRKKERGRVKEKEKRAGERERGGRNDREKGVREKEEGEVGRDIHYSVSPYSQF